MTTTSNTPHGHGLRLPDLDLGDSAEAIAQRPHARAREDNPAPAPDASRHVASADLWVQGLLNGASLWTAQPPSLAMLWDRHAASARHYNGALIRVPRYAWGAIHIGLATAIYFLAWITHSFPLFVCAVAIVAAAHWLL